MKTNLKIDSNRENNSKNQSIKPIFLAIYTRWFLVALFVFNSLYILPTTANAGFFSMISNLFSVNSQNTDTLIIESNSQNVPILTSSTNFDPAAAIGGSDINTTDDGESLVSENGPSGTQADMSNTGNTGQISKYIVKNGDNLASVAKMFGVTTNTILWANDISGKTLKIGQELIILPVSGTIHTVVKGDSLKSLAKKYKAEVGEIAQFNDLESGVVLAVGEMIIIPDGEGLTKISSTRTTVAVKNGVTAKPHNTNGPNYEGYYIRPITGGIRTQGLHGYNGIDIGARTGTPIYAAAAGQVIIAKSSGYNTGYGKYVVISHYNGTQTVYGHLSEVLVSSGQLVGQGEFIGLSGNTGKSTGPHLHFEVRGAHNPLAD